MFWFHLRRSYFDALLKLPAEKKSIINQRQKPDIMWVGDLFFCEQFLACCSFFIWVVCRLYRHCNHEQFFCRNCSKLRNDLRFCKKGTSASVKNYLLRSNFQLLVQKCLSSDGLSAKGATPSQRFIKILLIVIIIIKNTIKIIIIIVDIIIIIIINIMIIIIIVISNIMIIISIVVLTWVEYSSHRAANIALRLENVAASWKIMMIQQSQNYFNKWGECLNQGCLNFISATILFQLIHVANFQRRSAPPSSPLPPSSSSPLPPPSSLLPPSPSPSPLPPPSSAAAPHLLEKSQFIPELEHRLTDNTLLCVVFRLQAPEGHLSCLLVGLNKTIKCNIFFLKFCQIGWMARCLPWAQCAELRSAPSLWTTTTSAWPPGRGPDEGKRWWATSPTWSWASTRSPACTTSPSAPVVEDSIIELLIFFSPEKKNVRSLSIKKIFALTKFEAWLDRWLQILQLVLRTIVGPSCTFHQDSFHLGLTVTTCLKNTPWLSLMWWQLQWNPRTESCPLE